MDFLTEAVLAQRLEGRGPTITDLWTLGVILYEDCSRSEVRNVYCMPKVRV